MKIGDSTYFFTTTEENTKNKNIIKYIHAKPSRQSAWQIYLLYRSENMMPVFWHAAYDSKHFIFDESDVNEIEPLKCFDVLALSDSNLLLPNVEMAEDGLRADVFCTYWNNWEGLVREHIKITYNPDNTVDIKELDSLTLFNYKCDFIL
ncbi:MAG: hypothetical protein J1E02_07270 [Coprobacter sp.]|nr:hypothetical protein [Coprobacter sp.]